MSALAAALALPSCNVLLRTKGSLSSFKVSGGQTSASLDEAPPSSESPCALLKFSPAGDVAVVKEIKGTGDVCLVASDPATGSLALGSSTALEVRRDAAQTLTVTPSRSHRRITRPARALRPCRPQTSAPRGLS